MPYDDHSITFNDYTWTGDGSTSSWNDGDNWGGGVAPQSNIYACVTFAAIPPLSSTQHYQQYSPDFTGAPPLSAIIFAASGYKLVGGPITLVGGAFYDQTTGKYQTSDISVATGVTDPVITANLVVGLAGGGALEVAGPGRVTLSPTGQNTYTGGTVITAGGTLAIGTSGALAPAESRSTAAARWTWRATL